MALPAFAGALGLIASAGVSDPMLSMIALSVALIGIYAAIATSWTLPTAFLSGTAAAGGLALINSIGNLGGFAGPYFMGWIKTATGEYSLGVPAHRRRARALRPDRARHARRGGERACGSVAAPSGQRS